MNKSRRRVETYIDVSLLVAQEEVVHDGAVVKVLEGRHVLHASGAAVVHRLHLLAADCILLVGVNLQHRTEKRESKPATEKKEEETIRWFCRTDVVFLPHRQF